MLRVLPNSAAAAEFCCWRWCLTLLVLVLLLRLLLPLRPGHRRRRCCRRVCSLFRPPQGLLRFGRLLRCCSPPAAAAASSAAAAADGLLLLVGTQCRRCRRRYSESATRVSDLARRMRARGLCCPPRPAAARPGPPVADRDCVAGPGGRPRRPERRPTVSDYVCALATAESESRVLSNLKVNLEWGRPRRALPPGPGRPVRRDTELERGEPRRAAGPPQVAACTKAGLELGPEIMTLGCR